MKVISANLGERVELQSSNFSDIEVETFERSPSSGTSLWLLLLLFFFIAISSSD